MQYRSIDRLHDFEFHDAALDNGRLSGDTFTASLRLLNIHKDAPQNGGERDLEIERAQLTFEGVRDLTYEPGRVWHKDENGKSYADGPQVVFTGDEARAMLTAELEHLITLYSFTQTGARACSFDAGGDSPFFTFGFSFDHVIVEWEAYRGTAWYDTDEHRRWLRDWLQKRNDRQESS